MHIIEYVIVDQIMHTKGFTLIELLVTIAIVAILVAMATPSYQNYLRQARYSEIVQFVAPYKLGVELCFYTYGDIQLCQLASRHVPPAQHNDLIKAIDITAGIIKITPQAIKGFIEQDTYVLTPDPQRLTQDEIKWLISGGAVDKGYVSAE